VDWQPIQQKMIEQNSKVAFFIEMKSVNIFDPIATYDKVFIHQKLRMNTSNKFRI